jgi:hypothetical protein
MMSTTNTAGHSSSARPMQKTRGRRGTLFHYTLVYMTIASAILSVAGVILHSVLKADASDRRESLFLSSLSRAEQQLRKDSQTKVSDTGLKHGSQQQAGMILQSTGRLTWGY